ncbi:MAG: rhodanese-like domain-containing protein [Nitrospinota bacterium]
MAKTLQELIDEARREVPEMTVDEVKKLIDNNVPVLLLDVRDGEELGAGTLPGAVHASRGTLEMRVGRIGIEPETPIVTYCAAGVRSLFAAQRLKEMGFTDVKSMMGGFGAWQEAGY